MPAQVNASLVRVRSAMAARAGRDDFDNPGTEPAGAGVQRWAGAIDAYYTTDLTRVADGGAVTESIVKRLIIDTEDYQALTLDTDDVITYTIRGASFDATIRHIEVKDLDGYPRDLVTTTLELTAA